MTYVLSNSKILKTFFVLLLTILTLGIYLPLIPAAQLDDWDQMSYFTELNGSRKLSDGLRLSDYALMRKFGKGDDVLFRPLTFVWLALQNSWFWPFSHAWATANVALHLAIVIAFFFALWASNPHPLAGLFTLLFASLQTNFTSVLKLHSGGYLWGFICFTVALICLPKLNRPQWLWAAAIFLTMGAFFYEVILAAAPILAFMGAIKFPLLRKKILFFIWGIPWLFYFPFYFVHALQIERIFYIGIIFGNDLIDFKNWLFFPLALKRTLYAIPYYLLYPYDTDNKIYLDSIVVLVLLTLLPWKRKLKEILYRSGPLLIAILYVGMISQMRNSAALAQYSYFFYLVFIYGIYCLLEIPPGKDLRIRFFSMILIALIVLHLGNSFTAQRITLKDNPNVLTYQYFNRLEAFVRNHHREEGFNFMIQNPPEEMDSVFEFCEGYPDHPQQCFQRRFSDIFYSHYYNENASKYRLIWNEASKDFLLS